ncbi:MAG: TRAP transporter fused permease subunit, partial [Rhodospirillales bacterium]|nr:TRAP transporter fused permease subunit [Rhodospirillales bacterium]
MTQKVPEKTRHPAWPVAALISIICMLWSVELPRHLGFAIHNEQFLAPVLGMSIAVCFLFVRVNGSESARIPWYDIALAALGFLTLFYVAFNYSRLLDSVSERTVEHIVVSGITVLLVLEGLRRAVGWFMFSLIFIFIVYALFAHMIPGDLQGRNVPLDHLFLYLGFDPSAVFGSPLNVAATVVVLFIFMGRILFKAGGGEFFTNLAMATMGRTRGGSAKIAVSASAMFGSISGSAVANVVTTGMITIPMMRRGGYTAVNAGAVESVASTGGQLTPPIMGAAAFLMAEFLEIPYAEIVIAAIVPAFLYYLALFVQVDLIAARDKLASVDEEVPRTRDVLREGWHLLVPFVVLLYAIFELNLPPVEASLYSILSIIVFGFFKPYRGQKLNLENMASVLWETGFGTFRLILIVAAAGFVIGVLNITGLGFALTLFLVNLAGSNIFGILAISAVICIILGMGMPTSGVYVLLAALVASAIVESGVEPLAAHMFILYFGMLSMV